MSKFENYFTLYEFTDSPPIITEGYKLVWDTYYKYFNPIYTQQEEFDLLNNNISEDPLNIITESIKSNSFNTRENTNSLSNLSYTISSLNKQAKNIVNLARLFIGTKYLWGGMSPSTGFDCSGLIQYVFKQNGINLPRTTKELEKVGVEIPSLSDVLIGDLICTSSSGKSGKHVKIVSNVKDGEIFTIEAKGKKDGIIEAPLTNTSNITTIRRIINPGSNNFIIDYFINKGLTMNLARGIYGNLMLESGGNIKAVSKDGHNSYGLAQWTGSRKDKLFSMYGNNPTAILQLDFLWWELNNTHKDALESLKKTTTISDATRVFMDKFERPHKDYANFSKRLKYANSII